MAPKLNVRNFPRPPLLEKTSRHLLIKWNGKVIAETRQAYWVLETMHPPTYYLPPQSVQAELKPSSRSTFCEWKGNASYWNIADPDNPKHVVSNRIWSYREPTARFAELKDHLSFYAGPWDCYVDGEKVEPQPGDFYGGWKTSDIEGPIKGGPGTWGWKRHLSAPWRLGALVGFCGWLPFQADLKDAAKAPENVHRRLAAFFQTRLGIRPPASSSVLPSNTPFDSSTGPLRTPVFLGHAVDDDVIDVALGRQLRDTIGAPGLDMNVVWKEYAKGGHQINEEA
ncbi:hypothetical protein LTR39_004165, partial [Cryomyces antarcticus]